MCVRIIEVQVTEVLLYYVLQRMADELADRDEEIRSLRAKVRDLERALADMEEQLHRAELERNKVCVCVCAL